MVKKKKKKRNKHFNINSTHIRGYQISSNHIPMSFAVRALSLSSFVFFPHTHVHTYTPHPRKHTRCSININSGMDFSKPTNVRGINLFSENRKIRMNVEQYFLQSRSSHLTKNIHDLIQL